MVLNQLPVIFLQNTELEIAHEETVLLQTSRLTRFRCSIATHGAAHWIKIAY